MATETVPATIGRNETVTLGAPILSVTVEGAEDNQVKLRGMLQEVNLAERTCRVYTSDSEYVSCHFDNELETDVIYALGQDVEVAGGEGGHPRHRGNRSLPLRQHYNERGVTATATPQSIAMSDLSP